MRTYVTLDFLVSMRLWFSEAGRLKLGMSESYCLFVFRNRRLTMRICNWLRQAN